MICFSPHAIHCMDWIGLGSLPTTYFLQLPNLTRLSLPCLYILLDWRMNEELPGVRFQLVRRIGGIQLVKASWTEG